MPVAWGQLDAFAHVNNTVYFRWFEDARLAYFERIGFIAHMEQHQVGPILARTDCVFRRALKWPDTISAGARITDIGDDRFTMGYAVFSEALGGELAAQGEGRIVCYDYAGGSKAPLPASIRAAIESLEGG